MNENKNMFDEIMGDCCGIDMNELTADNIRATAQMWKDDGQPLTDYEIEQAILGLEEYQFLHRSG